jgi:hypothetical protein
VRKVIEIACIAASPEAVIVVGRVTDAVLVEQNFRRIARAVRALGSSLDDASHRDYQDGLNEQRQKYVPGTRTLGSYPPRDWVADWSRCAKKRWVSHLHLPLDQLSPAFGIPMGTSFRLP